jgi:hypothetical protein
MTGNLAHRSEQTENELVKETHLLTRRTPARLAFADHMDCLVAGNCAPSAPKRTEMLAGADPAFNGPVILFQDVVEVLHRSMSAVLLQSTLSF